MSDQYVARRTELLTGARQLAEKAQAEHRDLTTAENDQVQAALAEARQINERIAADAKSKQLLGKLDDMARGASAGIDAGQRLCFGTQMAEAAAAKIMPAGYGEKAVAPSGATVIAQTFSADPVVLGQPATSLLSILPVKVQPSANFAYLRQSIRTNAAAVVAEGAVKPTSVYSVTRIEQSLAVLAHLGEPCPRLWFVDVPQLQAFLNNELQYGLALAVEAKAIADISGTSGIQTQAYSTSVLQTLRKSLTRLEGNGYPPAAFVLHPNDWESVELALLTTPAIEYQALPLDPVSRRLWGIPVTLTVAQTAGVAHTLATGAVGLNTGSEGVQIAWSETSNADDWSRNLIRARCEGRYATSVFQPLGVVQSDLTA